MKLLILFFTLFIFINNTVQAELVIRHAPPESDEDERTFYYLSMLKLALDKTVKSSGEFRLQPTKLRMPQGRAMLMLEANQVIDIVWTMTSKKREKKLLPIRIPLVKGLLGCRIFIINKKDEEKFSKIKTLGDLNNFKAGQGHDWPDTQILKANNINVVTGSMYAGLFDMLHLKRFDYFPRGIHEAPAEVKRYKKHKFIIEKNIMLVYPAPIYFFVNRKNRTLAKRIENGLWASIKDGSFNKKFIQFAKKRNVFKMIKNRKIFRLKNPLLTPQTPINNKALWYISPK